MFQQGPVRLRPVMPWPPNGQSGAKQRGRGTGVWTSTLFLGQFVSPILLTAIGASIVIGASLYIARREARLAREAHKVAVVAKGEPQA